ncbi:MAG: flavin reductase family protein [Candidatus Aenigmatarchaeota archaeon]
MKFYYVLHPRPVVVIGSGSVNRNEINFFACSWITPVDDDNKIVGFSCWKGNYSYKLIKKYQQFSVNVVEDIDLIWKVGTSSGEKIDKVKEFEIEYFVGKKLDIPIIKKSLAYMECKVVKEVEFGETSFFFGKVENCEGSFDNYGIREFWKYPLHKAGKSFAFPSKELKFVR